MSQPKYYLAYKIIKYASQDNFRGPKLNIIVKH